MLTLPIQTSHRTQKNLIFIRKNKEKKLQMFTASLQQSLRIPVEKRMLISADDYQAMGIAGIFEGKAKSGINRWNNIYHEPNIIRSQWTCQ